MGDESTAMSEMSTADSTQQSTSTGGGEGEGKDSSSSRGMVMGIVLVLLLLGIFGGLAATGALGTKTDEESGGNTDDGTPEPGPFISRPSTTRTTHSSSSPGSSGSSSSSSSSTTSTSSISTSSSSSERPPTNPPPQYPGMFVCVVGRYLSSNESLVAGLCDYIIYPDLTIRNNAIVGTYGEPSWNIFKKAMKNPGAGVKAGGAFLESQPEGPESAIARMNADIKPVEKTLEGPLYFRALGFLNIKFIFASNLNPLKVPLQRFKELLRDKEGGMTFLGVFVAAESASFILSNELKGITYIDTVILQTHITPFSNNFRDNNCEVHYVGYRLGEDVRNVLTLPIADATVGYIRANSQFRIMFSSTLGVMIYTSKNEIKNYNDGCEYAFLATVDTLCPETGLGITLKDDTKELGQYATWEKDSRHHFLTTMDENTTKAFLRDFIKDKSQGWAAFNIELDEHNACKVGESLRILRTMSSIARTLKVT